MMSTESERRHRLRRFAKSAHEHLGHSEIHKRGNRRRKHANRCVWPAACTSVERAARRAEPRMKG
jgi:hypothetical protein